MALFAAAANSSTVSLISSTVMSFSWLDAYSVPSKALPEIRMSLADRDFRPSRREGNDARPTCHSWQKIKAPSAWMASVMRFQPAIWEGVKIPGTFLFFGFFFSLCPLPFRFLPYTLKDIKSDGDGEEKENLCSIREMRSKDQAKGCEAGDLGRKYIQSVSSRTTFQQVPWRLQIPACAHA